MKNLSYLAGAALGLASLIVPFAAQAQYAPDIPYFEAGIPNVVYGFGSAYGAPASAYYSVDPFTGCAYVGCQYGGYYGGYGGGYSYNQGIPVDYGGPTMGPVGYPMGYNGLGSVLPSWVGQYAPTINAGSGWANYQNYQQYAPTYGNGGGYGMGYGSGYGCGCGYW